MNCRHCQTRVEHVFLDLGFAPPSNAYLSADDLKRPETYFPLKLSVCHSCWLVQTEDQTSAHELFHSDYAYFSSTSSSWLSHAAQYVEMISERLSLGGDSFVIEVAANDGYLLRHVKAAGIRCLGIEPTDSTATAAEALGIDILREFFGSSLADRLVADGKQADLIIGNNVYGHVPDINDFTIGLEKALKPGGIVTLEFPHLLRLIQQCQFDTVYHEHFSYLSLSTVSRIFLHAGMRVFDVEELPTHGGSLRVYGCRTQDSRPKTAAVDRILAVEASAGLKDIATYSGFQDRANQIKDDLLVFLIDQKKRGRKVAGYGAAAKGNTLLNYAGIKPDLLPYVCDAAPSKQGKLLPGSHIPIVSPTLLSQRKPEVVLVFPWNILSEVVTQQAHVRDWGGVFVVALPELRII